MMKQMRKKLHEKPTGCVKSSSSAGRQALDQPQIMPWASCCTSDCLKVAICPVLSTFFDTFRMARGRI